MNWAQLDKIDTNLYKGLAILMIVTHNFMHLFPVPKQNEFNFSPARFVNLLNLLWNEPENSIRVTLSFFGHFGVQIFIFLSAYGLTKKYMSQQPIYWSFIWNRFIKIYPAFILAILFWAMITGWPSFGLLGPLKVLYWNLYDLTLKLTLISNFVPGSSLSPVGPWWFIPFIFQFYFIFPFLLKAYAKWGYAALLVLSIISVAASMLLHSVVEGIYISATVLGHLPELCLGIYLAMNDNGGLRFPKLLVIAAIIIYLLGNIYETFWYISHFSFLVILLVIFSNLVPKLKNYTKSKGFILFFGAISMPLFLVNGFLREPYIIWAKNYDNWLLTILLCLASLSTSIIVAIILSKTDRYVSPKLQTILQRNKVG